MKIGSSETTREAPNAKKHREKKHQENQSQEYTIFQYYKNSCTEKKNNKHT